IGALTETTDAAHAVLFALMRTAAQPGFSQIGEQAADLIARQPLPFAAAAPVLAATLPQPGPLRDGLLRLGQHDPMALWDSAFTKLDELPEISVSGASFSAALTTVITDLLRTLAEAMPHFYLPALAVTLTNLGSRLSQAGRRQDALAPAEEA